MKVLFDANLSPALVTGLGAEYPGSTHVRDVGLRAGSDAEIWEYAKGHGFVIVSKDTDFRELSFVNGFPPKVVWLDVGNAGTLPIADLLRRERRRPVSVLHLFGGSDRTPTRSRGTRCESCEVWLDPVRLARSGGHGAAELREIERLVRTQEQHFLRAWHEYFTITD